MPSGASLQPAAMVKQTFDPKALLNPKAAAKRSNNDSDIKEPANPYGSEAMNNKNFQTSSPKRSQPEGELLNGDPGQFMMLERMHNVGRREDQPQKRLKKDVGVDEDGEELVDVGKKADFSGGSKGGVLGEYVKQKREEGKAENDVIIDLTETEGNISFWVGNLQWLTLISDRKDNDDVIFVQQSLLGNKSDTREVCLGKIEHARVNAHRVPTPKQTNGFAASGTATHWPPMKVTLQRRPGSATQIIGVIDPTGHDFGTIDVRVASVLAPLMDGNAVTKIRLQARLDMREKKAFNYPGQQVSDMYNITINVYAPVKMVAMIGKIFSQKGVWLRQPLMVDRGTEIMNPHEPKDHTPKRVSQIFPSSSRIIGTTYVSRTTEEVRADVLKLFDSMAETDHLPLMEPTGKTIITPLLPHQKQALYFLTEREKGTGKESLWQETVKANGKKMWFNVITGHETAEQPEPTLGGILADVMGLGKTLQILALLAETLKEATIFGRKTPPAPVYDDDPIFVTNSAATLIITPLSTISNWEDQLRTHIRPKGINYIVYHGTNRTSDTRLLAGYDVVITTYSVVSAESDSRSKKRKNKPLFEVNWFRIVLDEAHMIREQTTRQSKAVCSLSSHRRWAVTGTPVQNRLDDLGALIKFLRIKPFDDKSNFAQFITAPFKSADTEILPKLRLLVDSITLRRLKDRIDLPKRDEQIVELKFSDSEQGLYDWFAKDSKERINALAGKQQGVGGKGFAHILRAILRLRLLCAHGADLLTDEDYAMAKGFSVTNAIDLEDEDNIKPDVTPRQAFEMLRMMKDANVATCAKCSKAIVASDDLEEDEDETLGFLTPCNQLICPKCKPAFEKELKANAGPDNFATCTICEMYIRVVFFELKQRAIEADEQAQMAIRQNPKLAKHSGRYGGPHTKTVALINALKGDQATSAENPDDRPIKSVVFSGWTSHLDLLQIALTDNQIPFVRLDGSMTRPARAAALKSFDLDPEICVILVSITAGGLGLNLTVASRVYVMEPQFNPAAEAQAIERVHRLGQERPVMITRYIMKDSFEESVLVLQKKKMNLANISLDKDQMKMNKKESAKQRMEELRSLFR